MCTVTAGKDHLKALVKVPEFDGCDIVYCRNKKKRHNGLGDFTLQEGPLW